MSLLFDAASGGYSASGTTLTVSHTCTGTNGLLLASVTVDGSQTASVTYNGIAMTSANSQVSNTTVLTYLFYLANPATGAHNIVVTTSGTCHTYLGAASYVDVRQTLPLDSTDKTSTASASSLTKTISPTYLGSWAFCAGFSGSGTITAGTGVTTRHVEDQAGQSNVIGDSNGQVTAPYSQTINLGGTTTGSLIVATFFPNAPITGGGFVNFI